ncbi:Interferon, alpha-inducible protein 6 [Desmophyllum pertusum]|uniref:Interferon, alpha-inducible protein 6 n=1 Tax=Desmophyllum pertusum TaxID=174260 RepID=A0A9W9ZNF7_9CNID|nr:Interferon, alpha-inducible protein 6 [Desmophyllum pertusum]
MRPSKIVSTVMKWKFILCLLLILTCLSPTYGRDHTSDQSEDSEGSIWCLKDYAFGIVAGTIAVVAIPFVLTWMGFTAAGVAAGSIAASIQSFVYGGAVGSTSIFAAFSEHWSCWHEHEGSCGYLYSFWRIVHLTSRALWLRVTRDQSAHRIDSRTDLCNIFNCILIDPYRQ